MKTKRIVFVIIANLILIVLVVSIFNRKNNLNRYGDRFRPNSFLMSDSIVIDSEVSKVFSYFIHHYDEIYALTAARHKEFIIQGADSIYEGAHICCVEGEADEMVYHNYVVNRIIPHKLIYKSSEPSIVRIITDKGIREQYCNSFVYVDFSKLSPDKTMMKFTIMIQMPDYFYKLVGIVTGGNKAKNEWRDHLKEELTGFRDVYYAENQILK